MHGLPASDGVDVFLACLREGVEYFFRSTFVESAPFVEKEGTSYLDKLYLYCHTTSATQRMASFVSLGSMTD